MKQLAINIIVKLWPIMPRRVKLWAFMNDELSDEPDDGDTTNDLQDFIDRELARNK